MPTHPKRSADHPRDDTERGEHPTDAKERIQRQEPRDGRVRERGPNTGGGKLRPSDRWQTRRHRAATAAT